MLEAVLMNSKTKELELVRELYIHSFPSNERREFNDFLHMNPSCFEPYLFYDKNLFVGFAFLLTYKDITHILYFSVIDHLRDHGYGSMILKVIHDMKKGQRIIADVEREGNTDNDEQRIKRKAFYFKNGYHYSDVKYRWRNENYDVLVYGENFTYEEFHDFWENVDSKTSA